MKNNNEKDNSSSPLKVFKFNNYYGLIKFIGMIVICCAIIPAVKEWKNISAKYEMQQINEKLRKNNEKNYKEKLV